ncbi:hypothetical protein AMS58_09830 [Pseudoalteromonas porphyrae]|uniref:hypothetical protein n=1 Tax=Pseudoalteromonas TaxID=53246 RepID=UPI0006BA7895|nr:MULTISPECIES: hypothetical protein [Pseudoalteromonas]KPH94807.1 hypothetical protein AMS58_09830 [Pseudoalteromonas porphyrae]
MKLYRGLGSPKEDGIHKNWYLDKARKPRDSYTNVHQVADDWFNKTFGIKARSQTIFCSTYIGQTKDYTGTQGYTVEVTIPDDEYTLVYSPNVHDFCEIEDKISNLNNDDEIITWLQKQDYRRIEDIHELPSNFKGEVMLYCERYSIKRV